MGGVSSPDFVHSCSFCGWAHACATPVMLSPLCARCGCPLDARAARAFDAAAPAERLFSLPPRALAALRALALLLGVLALWAAASLGFHAAGAPGALVAFGAGGFLMLPFVPERLGAPRAR